MGVGGAMSLCLAAMVWLTGLATGIDESPSNTLVALSPLPPAKPDLETVGTIKSWRAPDVSPGWWHLDSLAWHILPKGAYRPRNSWDKLFWPWPWFWDVEDSIVGMRVKLAALALNPQEIAKRIAAQLNVPVESVMVGASGSALCNDGSSPPCNLLSARRSRIMLSQSSSPPVKPQHFVAKCDELVGRKGSTVYCSKYTSQVDCDTHYLDHFTPGKTAAKCSRVRVCGWDVDKNRCESSEFLKDCPTHPDFGCAVRTASTAAPPPSPWCINGVFPHNKLLCCAASCGTCGGKDCQKRPGGSQMCCYSAIKKSGVQCENGGQVACIVPRSSAVQSEEVTKPGAEDADPGTAVLHEDEHEEQHEPGPPWLLLYSAWIPSYNMSADRPGIAAARQLIMAPDRLVGEWHQALFECEREYGVVKRIVMFNKAATTSSVPAAVATDASVAVPAEEVDQVTFSPDDGRGGHLRGGSLAEQLHWGSSQSRFILRENEVHCAADQAALGGADDNAKLGKWGRIWVRNATALPTSPDHLPHDLPIQMAEPEPPPPGDPDHPNGPTPALQTHTPAEPQFGDPNSPGGPVLDLQGPPADKWALVANAVSKAVEQKKPEAEAIDDGIKAADSDSSSPDHPFRDSATAAYHAAHDFGPVSPEAIEAAAASAGRASLRNLSAPASGADAFKKVALAQPSAEHYLTVAVVCSGTQDTASRRARRTKRVEMLSQAMGKQQGAQQGAKQGTQQGTQQGTTDTQPCKIVAPELEAIKRNKAVLNDLMEAGNALASVQEVSPVAISDAMEGRSAAINPSVAPLPSENASVAGGEVYMVDEDLADLTARDFAIGDRVMVLDGTSACIIGKGFTSQNKSERRYAIEFPKDRIRLEAKGGELRQWKAGMTDFCFKMTCAARCKAAGFCCNDPEVGSNQFLSCAQACMIRALGELHSDGGTGRAECEAEVRAPRGCNREVGTRNYTMCQACNDLTPKCPHGVGSIEEGLAGCEYGAFAGASSATRNSTSGQPSPPPSKPTLSVG